MVRERDSLERRPTTRDELLHILSMVDQNTLFGATMHASFCLAFAGFLGIGEFAWNAGDLDEEFARCYVIRRSMVLHDDYIEFTLPSSKPDLFRKGITLTIAVADDEACPLRSLRHLFNTFPTLPSLPLFNRGRPFTRQLVNNVLRNTIKSWGFVGHYLSSPLRYCAGARTSCLLLCPQNGYENRTLC